MPLKPPDYYLQAQSNYLQNKAWAAIVYLSAVRLGIDAPETLEFYDGATIEMNGIAIAHVGPEIKKLVDHINEGFAWVDREPLKHHMLYLVGREYVSDCFPTARERLVAREWLEILLIAMGRDVRLLDAAFPTSSK